MKLSSKWVNVNLQPYQPSERCAVRTTRLCEERDVSVPMVRARTIRLIRLRFAVRYLLLSLIRFDIWLPTVPAKTIRLITLSFTVPYLLKLDKVRCVAAKLRALSATEVENVFLRGSTAFREHRAVASSRWSPASCSWGT